MDGEPINKSKRDDLSGLVWGVIGDINFKIAGMLFLVIIALNTTVVIDKVFSKWSGAVTIGKLTERGVVMQSMFICMAYILLDVLVQKNAI